MVIELVDLLALSFAVIGGIILFILVRKATRGRRRNRGAAAPNVNLIIALATFVMVMVIFLFVRFWKY
jgi:heme/copper-type cytochrome/quinol oxidase subunit 2